MHTGVSKLITYEIQAYLKKISKQIQAQSKLAHPTNQLRYEGQ